MLEGYGAYEIIMMLHELHKRDYQQLRILPGMSPNGCCWRWFIYPKALMKDNARMEWHNDIMPFECPHGTTRHTKTGCDYKELADQFMALYPDIALLGKGKDEEYMKWFQRLVRHAKRDCFPIAFADGPVGEEWGWTASRRKLPYPPFTPSEKR